MQVRPGLPEGAFLLQLQSKTVEQLPNPGLPDFAHPDFPGLGATRYTELAWAEGPCGHPPGQSMNLYLRPRLHAGALHRWGTER